MTVMEKDRVEFDVAKERIDMFSVPPDLCRGSVLKKKIKFKLRSMPFYEYGLLDLYLYE